ncbi:MAG: hypothetical protein QOF97_528 [Acidimicrobiaceae bacterium]
MRKLAASIAGVLLIGFVVPAVATADEPATWRSASREAASQRPVHPKLASNGLRAPGDARPRSFDASAPSSAEGRSLVTVDGSDEVALKRAVEAAGGDVVLSAPGSVQAKVPDANLGSLSDSADVSSVHPPRRLQPATTSEGVSNVSASRTGASGAQAWQSSTPAQTGAGTKVAIVDVGFASYQSKLGNELPSTVVTINHCGPGTTGFDGSGPDGSWGTISHGTAVAEIVHDMAPGAQLLLICVFQDSDFSLAVDDLTANGVRIANASIGNDVASRGDGSGAPGSAAMAMKTARERGQLWAVSAGNEAAIHFSFIGSDVEGDTAYEMFPGPTGSGIDAVEDYTFQLGAGGVSDIQMKWDAWPATNVDVFLCVWQGVVDSSTLLGCSTQNQSTNPGEPVDMARFGNTTGSTQTYHVAVLHAAGAPTVARFDLYFHGNEVNRKASTAESSLSEPASSPFVMTVGAHCYSSGASEPFSSQGPTIDGRHKPDISGPDGVSNSVFGLNTGGVCGQGGFRGTSASSPHVAGAAALLLSANPSLDAAELQGILQSRAIDAGALGQDDVFGTGRLALGATPSAANPLAAPRPARFKALGSPVRVLDTRTGTGHAGPLAAGEDVVFDFATAQVPATATAVVLNLTVDRPSGNGGFLTLYPFGGSRPNASNINFNAGQTVANHVTVAVGAHSGKASIRIFNATGSTPMIVDITGYYGGSGATAGDQGFEPVDPTRILDTRPGTVGPIARQLTPSESFDFTVAGRGPVPADAQAVIVNLTATRSSGGGFLSLFPKGGTSGGVSNVNFGANQDVPNLVVVKLGTAGQVTIANSAFSSVDVILDVVGYFRPSGANGFVAMNPIRDLDARTGNGPRLGPLAASEVFNLDIGGVNVVPSDAVAAQMNTTVVAIGGGFLSVFPAGVSPSTSNLNFRSGQVVANAVVTKLAGDGHGGFAASAPVFVINDLAGYFSPS